MNLRKLSFVFLIFGILTFLLSFKSITGAVVSESSFFSNGILSVIGLLFFIGGLILLLNQATLERRVSVYEGDFDKEKKKKKHFMTDPRLSFGTKGVVSLEEFKHEIENYKSQGENGEVLIEIIRDEYEPDLREIASSKDSEKASIARAFLRVLNPLEKSLDDSQEEYHGLSREERREIHLAFRGWDGDLHKIDKQVRQKYGIEGEHGGKHITLYQSGYEDNTVSASSSPSVPMGDRLATLLIRMIEKNRKEHYKKSED